MASLLETYEHELAVLACLFGDWSFAARARVEVHEFLNPRYRKLFEMLLALKAEEYQSRDVKEWIAEAARRCKEPFDDLLNATGCGCPYNLERMRLLNKQRKIQALAEECGVMSSDEIMGALRKLSADQINLKHRREVDVLEYAKKDYREYLKSRAEKKDGIYSGRKLFDSKVGLERGQFCILAARPGIGKSALALNLAYEWAQFGFSVYYASLEMSTEELTHRLYARVTNMTSTKFKYGTVEDATLIIAERELSGMSGKIQIGYLPGSTIDEILQCASAKMPDILIVDHIDLIRPTGKADNEAYAIAQMTSAMKAYAGQKNCLVFCLSQFNRESKGDMPELHQLRGSGAKEQDSDVVLILHRSLNPDEEGFRQATLRIAKNRSGQAGEIGLKFTPETTLFEEA